VIEIKKIFEDLQHKKGYKTKLELHLWLKSILNVHEDTIKKWANYMNPDSEYYPALESIYKSEMGIPEDVEEIDYSQLVELKKKKKLKMDDIIELFKTQFINEVNAFPPIKIDKIKIPTGTSTPETMVLLLSDTQLGHETKSYNFQVFRERLKKLQKRIIQIAKVQMADHPIKRLVVFALGDLIQNELLKRFVDLNELEGTVMEQIKIAIDPVNSFASFFLGLNSVFEQIDIYTIAGNHGMTHKDASPDCNWDSIIYMFWKALLQNQENINIHLHEDFYHKVQVENMNFLLVHGDGIRSYMGLPYYGIDRMNKNWFMTLDDYDCCCIGHFHQRALLPCNFIPIYVNGTFVTDDMYALKKLGARSRPIQTCFFVHPKIGITAEYPLYLDIDN